VREEQRSAATRSVRSGEGAGILDNPLAEMFTARLAEALGVTRVARVTGLDRAGVEVACAIRPAGHVLQVSNGKGLSPEQAALGALLEAAELACAEAPALPALTWASTEELRARGVAHFAAAELGGEAADGLRLAWSAGAELSRGRRTLVPACAVFAPPQGGPSLGLARLRWTSNGMGAHPARGAALAHALLEAAERHALARALPDGWTEEACALARLVVAGRAAPRAAALARRISARGFEVHFFHLPSELGIPVAAALLFDVHDGPVPLTAGYASRLDLDEAAVAALLEAAQSRLTDIHGAREDVGQGDARAVRRMRRACRAGGRDRDGDRDSDRERDLERDLDLDLDRDRDRDRPDRDRDRHLERKRKGDADHVRDIRIVLSRLRRAGFPRAVAVDLASPELGVHVVKVLVPGFACSELL
jgi:ribosomal protein S12 methylthiotransferase accessory factor